MASALAAGVPAGAAQLSVPRGDLAPEPPPRVPEIRVPQSVPGSAPTGAESVSLVLRDVVIDGSTVYDAAALQPYYQGDIGQTVTLARLFEIAAAIETRYREDGYVLSRAIIPAQTIDDGVFRVRVVEGFIGNVVVEGDIGPVRSLVEAYAQKITAHRPVNIADMERYLLLINDIPGIAARSVPRPGGGEVGAAELVVLVQRKWYEGFAFADNRGSKFLGPVTGAVGGALNSFTRFGEQTQAVLFGAESGEQVVGQLSYEQHIGTEGLTVSGFVTYGKAWPGSSLEQLDIESETFLANLEAEYPLIRTRDLSLWVKAGFDYINGETDILNAPQSDDKLRVLYASARMEFRDRWRGINQARVGIRQGIDAFGASDKGDDDLSRAEGKPVFTAVGAQYARLQPIAYGLSAYVRVEGQYAFNDLLAGEEFAIGGLTYGRGYDPAELSGEHGIGMNLELRYGLTDLPYVQDAEFYVFYDYGKIWNEDNLPSSASVESAGLGVRIGVTDWLAAEFELAKPLGRELVTRGGNPWRGFFNVTARF